MDPYSLPLKIGFPRRSSARIHPTDQTSIAVDWVFQNEYEKFFDQLRETHIVSKAQHDLWRSIPPGGNVFSHEALVGTSLGTGPSPRRVPSCKTEVADLEFAVGVNQEVARLEVTMNNVSRVNVLETAKGLINKRLEMSV